MRVGSIDFRQVWFVDFEFTAPAGEQPIPICLVAKELVTRQVVRLWEDDLRRRPEAPYPTAADVLTVAYYASAEMGCHLALGWPTPGTPIVSIVAAATM